MSQSTDQAREFVQRSQRRLATVAAVAFLVALLVSLPMIGRMANPVELLEQAQAEMSAVFEANLDGLVVLDETGHITMANTAAAVALGLEAEDLQGQVLKEVIPAQTMSALTAGGGHLVQRAELEREGRRWQVRRTFFRVRATDESGSILLLHESPDEDDAQDQFLEAVTPALLEGDQRVMATLVELSRILRRSFSLSTERLAVLEVASRAASRAQVELAVEGELPHVEADAERLELALVNLLQGASKLELRRDGGAVRLTVEGASTQTLTLSRRIVELHGGRLEQSGTALSFTLPASPD